METRTITEYKVHLLFLNPMRERFENMDLVAFADNHEALWRFYQAQKTEPYYDDESGISDVFGNDRRWYKVFKKGSVLEWYNEIDRDDQIQERWVTQETLDYLNSHKFNASCFVG